MEVRINGYFNNGNSTRYRSHHIPDVTGLKNAQDIMNAVAVGIVSGLASTGADQVVKQTKKAKEE